MRDEADRADDHWIAGSRAPAALREDERRDGGVLVQVKRVSKDRNDGGLRCGLLHRIPEILEHLQGLRDREILLVTYHAIEPIASTRDVEISD